MTDFVVVSYDKFSNRRWRRFTKFNFAINDVVCPVVEKEIAETIMVLPVAFTPLEDDFHLVAVQGFTQERNLLVAPDGRWRARYVPEAYRCYPFQLADVGEGKLVLCIDQESGLITEDASDEQFFNADQSIGETLTKVLDFLKRNFESRRRTNAICAALKNAGLIKPWPINLEGKEGSLSIDGLFCIDEPALNNLSAETLIELRDLGALAVAYCQLLSMNHIYQLGNIFDAELKGNTTPRNQVNLDFLNNEETISFKNI